MQLLIEFFPLIAFFVAFVAFDLYVATATLIVAMALQIGYQWFRHRKVNKMLLVSGALAAVFGGITLALRNPVFIQWKVTVVYWLLAIALLGSQLFGAKNLTERAMGQVAELEPAAWRLLNTVWIVTFGAIGAINLYVMYHFDVETWVYFKTWGVIGLLVLMIVGQAFWITSRATDKSPDSGGGN
jgi:intracellular septation protein